MEIGDWVQMRFLGCAVLGYVTKIYHGQGVFSVRKIAQVDKDGKAEYFNKETYGKYGMSQAEYVAAGLFPEDHASMIDLALMTKDKEWFENLMKKASVRLYIS
ncbi:hypothetical protein [Domibacillus aminovorans]|uniref:IDEAL domain-containing protein n=1 Tax=Domibacillus aminovorans TaxID=29332 RepID=A0A177L7R1_9BACI|nr:hypothetical protein [Domibacillus aminovorans]OAH60741.1 hypothetical protein AWH49_15485 [Domibacillus aminovorans]